MSKQIGLGLAAVMVAALFSTSVEAQGYQDGYQLGAGFRSGYGPGIGIGGGFLNRPFLGYPRFSAFTPRFEEPPYFAKFPPVHYSGVIPRPYGISPYAAPPGIMPTEMMIRQEPAKIKNPFFSEPAEEIMPPADPPEEGDGGDQEISTRVTRIANPWFGALSQSR